MTEKETIVDYTGKPVAVGDIVVFTEPYYHNLIDNPVKKITPKGIKVDYTTYYNKVKETYIANGQFVIIDKKEG